MSPRRDDHIIVLVGETEKSKILEESMDLPAQLCSLSGLLVYECRDARPHAHQLEPGVNLPSRAPTNARDYCDKQDQNRGFWNRSARPGKRRVDRLRRTVGLSDLPVTVTSTTSCARIPVPPVMTKSTKSGHPMAVACPAPGMSAE
jgi:hypothetical protein